MVKGPELRSCVKIEVRVMAGNTFTGTVDPSPTCYLLLVKGPELRNCVKIEVRVKAENAFTGRLDPSPLLR